MTISTLPEILNEIETRAEEAGRLVVALAGPPASGKSTLAAGLAKSLGPHAAVLPMDGFHLENDQLRQMGLLHRKGAPETFDALGFVALIGRLRGDGVVHYPTFDRETDCTVPDGGQIGAATRIILVEGNYLLLKTPPWDRLAGLFDMSVHLQVGRGELESRLIARWIEHGLPPDAARARAMSNDMKNADFVVAHSYDADFTLR